MRAGEILAVYGTHGRVHGNEVYGTDMSFDGILKSGYIKIILDRFKNVFHII